MYDQYSPSPHNGIKVLTSYIVIFLYRLILREISYFIQQNVYSFP